ncbi:MAG: radical SAM protein [Candidatus Omnitrophica bacterium]|nr:radical SAM protein [Candidatus Omnitrophota bacterium]
MDLLNFRKPQRYIGNEWNVTKKDHQGRISVALIYPNLYEVGMSNVGLRIIYGALNSYDNIVCERSFLPGEDMALAIKNGEFDLFSLETKTALKKFDCLAFNLSSELNYTNFLNILSYSGVSLIACQRETQIVLAGAISNPEPLSEFVDVFFIGEFEAVIDDFVSVLSRYSAKNERLKALSEIAGFYVPKFYAVDFDGKNYIVKKNYQKANLPIKRVYVKDLNTSFYPGHWVTPNTAITHDRAQVEISRGCPNRCTFCQAQAVYHPYRERSPQRVMELIKEIYAQTGYENFSFLSLSASDYSRIEELIDLALDFFRDKQIGLSLPSLRIGDIVGKLYTKLSSIKKTSLTLAVEAADDCLRQRLNKKIDIDTLFDAAHIVKALGVKNIKTYFMFGFPDEPSDNVLRIAEFIKKLGQETHLNINASINAFIPKPFSVWENVEMADLGYLNENKNQLLQLIPRSKKRVLGVANIEQSILEAVLARGDRALSKVLMIAHKKGDNNDGDWACFSWKLWQDSFSQAGIDYEKYLKVNTENFPWSFIEVR